MNKRSLPIDIKLAAIGVMIVTQKLSQKKIDAVDIEGTLATFVAFYSKDSKMIRMLSPVLSWVAVHGSSVIIEKLIKVLSRHQQENQNTDCVALISLVAKVALSHGHKRWSTVLKKFKPQKEKLFFVSELTKSLLSLRGPDPMFKDSGFLVPKGVVEINPKWTLARASLARLNRQYRNRLIYGAQWRADIITAFELGADTPTKASRMSGASYEPCHRVLGELQAAGLKIAG